MIRCDVRCVSDMMWFPILYCLMVGPSLISAVNPAAPPGPSPHLPPPKIQKNARHQSTISMPAWCAEQTAPVSAPASGVFKICGNLSRTFALGYFVTNIHVAQCARYH